MRTIADLQNGETGRIRGITATGEMRRRLLDMGLVKGTDVMMERRAPLGDPLVVRVMGYRLSLRGVEAGMISLEGV